MAAQWPQYLTNAFLSANVSKNILRQQSAYYGPYIRLLYHLFGIEGPFEITVQFDVPDEVLYDMPDVVATFTVEFNKHPVLFIQPSPHWSFDLHSQRKRAENQIVTQVGDMKEDLVTPRLHAISAFGTHLAFYEYTAATNILTPPRIAADPILLNELAPADRWGFDVLEADGIARIHQVAQDVRAMCEALGN